MEEGKAVDDTERPVARGLQLRGRRAGLRASPRQQSEAGPFDLIGGIHGCLDTAPAMLARFGYESVDGWVHRHPEGHRALFLGDYIDRGHPLDMRTRSPRPGATPVRCSTKANSWQEKSYDERGRSHHEPASRARLLNHYRPRHEGGGFVFVTGQVAVKPNDDAAERRESIREMGTIAEQTRQVLENIKAILEHAGSSLDLVAKRNIFLSHPGDFDEVHGMLEEYFGRLDSSLIALARSACRFLPMTGIHLVFGILGTKGTCELY